jgi:hypothetical protein
MLIPYLYCLGIFHPPHSVIQCQFFVLSAPVQQMDIRNMSAFQTATFAYVVDKGTLDALLCAEDGESQAEKCLAEVFRVLSPGGIYAFFSYGTPELRVKSLSSQPWTIHHKEVPTTTSPEMRYLYHCQCLPFFTDVDHGIKQLRRSLPRFELSSKYLLPLDYQILVSSLQDVTCSVGLHSLHLNAVRMNDDAIIVLMSGLEENSSLTLLELRDNSIALKGALALANTLSRCRVTDLDLRGNKITDDGIAALLSVAIPFRSLSISENSLSSRGILQVLSWAQSQSSLETLIVSGLSMCALGELALTNLLTTAVTIRRLDLTVHDALPSVDRCRFAASISNIADFALVWPNHQVSSCNCLLLGDRLQLRLALHLNVCPFDDAATRFYSHALSAGGIMRQVAPVDVNSLIRELMFFHDLDPETAQSLSMGSAFVQTFSIVDGAVYATMPRSTCLEVMDLTVAQRWRVLSDVAQALSSLHSCGWNHGAVSTESVVLDDDIEPVLTARLLGFSNAARWTVEGQVRDVCGFADVIGALFPDSVAAVSDHRVFDLADLLRSGASSEAWSPSLLRHWCYTGGPSVHFLAVLLLSALQGEPVAVLSQLVCAQFLSLDFTDADATFVRELQVLLEVKSEFLDVVSLAGVSVGGIRMLAALLSLPTNNTTQIDLYDSPLSDDGGLIIGQCLSHHHSLTSLRLSNVGLGDVGATAVANALTHSKLHELCLDDNVIGDSGATALSHALTVNSSLYKLSCQHNCLTPLGCAVLEEVLQANVTLIALDLEDQIA